MSANIVDCGYMESFNLLCDSTQVSFDLDKVVLFVVTLIRHEELLLLSNTMPSDVDEKECWSVLIFGLIAGYHSIVDLPELLIE